MSEGPFALRGGNLALDFANTVGWHAREVRGEYLTSYPLLLAFARQTGAVLPAEAARFAAAAEAAPDLAARQLAGAIALREAIYHLFSAHAAARPLPAGDLATLNAALPTALAHLRLAATVAGPTLTWAEAGDTDLDRPLWPVVRAAADLLTAPELARVRECAGTGCGWLFLDTSRNGTRRWCDSRDCGNRERVRRHYARKKRVVGRES